MANSLLKSMLMGLANIPEYEDSPKPDKKPGCISECNVEISNSWFNDKTTLRLYPEYIQIIRTRHNTNAKVPTDQIIQIAGIKSIDVTTTTNARLIRFGDQVPEERRDVGQYFPNEVVFDEKYLQQVNRFVAKARERSKNYTPTKGFESFVNNGTINIFNYSETVNVNYIYQLIEEQGGADREELKSVLDDVQRIIKMMESEQKIPNDQSIKERIGRLLEKHPDIIVEMMKLAIKAFGKAVFGV